MNHKTLISVESLLSHRLESWVLIDCRFALNDTKAGRKAYLGGHLPGAIYAHMDEDLSGPIIPGETGRHPWLSPQAATALVRRWGIQADTQIVAYDHAGGVKAARVWWMMRWLGHEKVAVLDGGIAAWEKAGGELVSGQELAGEPSLFEPNLQHQLITDADDVELKRQDPAYQVVDARGAARFRGEMEPIDPIAGHVPGAVNRPFPGNLNDAGFFLDREALRARFEPVIAERPTNHIIHYCGSGVSACHNLLAIAHAGLGDGCLYTESWSGWLAKGTRPVATGDA